MLDLTLPVAGLKELIVEELGGRPISIALFFSIEMLAYLVAAPVWGALSDRWRRRRIFLVIGFAGSGLLSSFYLLAGTVQELLLLRFFQGAFSVMGWSTALTVVADRATGRDRSRAMGLAGASIILGVGCGAPLGGWLAGAYGPRIPLALAAAIFGLLAAGSLLLAEPPSRAPRKTFSEIVSTLLEQPRLLAPWSIYFWVRAAVGLLVVVLPLHLEATSGASPERRGELLGLFLLTFAAFQTFTYRLTDRLGARNAMALGLALFGSGLAWIPWLTGTLLSLWMLLLGAAAAVLFPPTLSLTVAWTPGPSRATGLAGFNLAGSLGFGLGPLGGVPLVEALGYRGTFALLGALSVLLAFLVAWRLTSLEEDRSLESDASPLPSGPS